MKQFQLFMLILILVVCINTANALIYKCPANCKTCLGSICLTCKSGSYFHNFKCLNKCPSGFVSRKDGKNKCYECHSSCSTCSDIFSLSCLTCPVKKALYKGLCLNSCPFGLTKDTNGVCKKQSTCPDNCDTCDSAGKCLTCKPNNYLNPDSTCKASCPGTYYPDQSSQVCQKCDSENNFCENCSSQTTCSSCITGYFLSGTECVQTCPDFSYGNENSGNCEPCDESCQQCSGPLETQCITCKGTRLFQYRPSFQSSYCVTQCDERYYPQEIDNQRLCQPCYRACQTCVLLGNEENNQCLTCPRGSIQSGNQCIQQ